MGRRLILGLAVLVSGVCGQAVGFSVPVAAHVEAGNNGVSAVMHIAPDDNPTAGQPTLIIFYMSGQGQNFSVASCGCQLEVRKDGKVVSTAIVEPADETTTDGQASVTFPDEGVYDFRLTGTDGGRKFVIPYVVRANPAGGTTDAAAGTNVLMVGLASLAIVSILAYYNITRGGRYRAAPVKSR